MISLKKLVRLLLARGISQESPRVHRNGDFQPSRKLLTPDILRCESGGTLKTVLRCSGLKARSLCDGGSITQRLRSPQSEVELQFCDDPHIAHALRCQNAADGCRIPLTNIVGSHAQ